MVDFVDDLEGHRRSDPHPRLRWAGAYDSGVVYFHNDVVVSLGTVWRCRERRVIGVSPPPDSTSTNPSWEIFAVQTSGSSVIPDGSIGLVKLADIPAFTFLGNTTGSPAAPQAFNVAAAKTLLALASTDISDFVEAAQDAVGLEFTNTATIDLIYDDVGNAVSANLKNSAVTYAKVQDVVGLSVIGRSPNSTGLVAAITAGTDQVLREQSGVLGFGTVATGGIANSAVTLAKMANIADQTVLGNNSGGAAAPIALTVAQVKTLLAYVPGDITGFNEAAQDAVGTILVDTATIDFTYDDAGNAITADVKDASVTYAKIQNVAGLSIIGRSAGTTGIAAAITATTDQVLREQSGVLGFGQIAAGGIASNAVTTAKILDSNVTLAKIANIADQTVLGNVAGSSAAPVALTATQATSIFNVATLTLKGLMSSTDKKVLDSVLNVIKYGAVGDDSTNNLSAFTTALSDAGAGKKALFVPAGIYRGLQSLTIPAGVVLYGEGQGASILKTDHATADMLTAGGDGVSIRGLGFNTTVTRTGGWYVNSGNRDNFHIEDFAMDFGFEGIKLGTGFWNRVENGQLTNLTPTTGVGIRVAGTFAGRIANVRTDANASFKPYAGILIESCGDLTIDGCVIERMLRGLSVEPGSGKTVASLRSTNSFFDDCGTYGVALIPTSSGAIVRSDFHQCWMQSAGAGTIMDSTAGTATIDGVEFVGCHMVLGGGTGSVAGGLHVLGARTKNWKVLGGRYAQNTNQGIKVGADVSYWAIIGATIGATDGLSGNDNGLIIAAGTTDHIQVFNNDVTGNTTTNYSNGGSGTDHQVFGNRGLDGAIGSAADRIMYTSALNIWSQTALTSFMRTVLDDVDGPTACTTLGVAEAAQDAVGAALTDTATIDFTYDDAGNTITADVKDASITAAKLAANQVIATIEIVIDGGGAVLTTGLKGYLEIPFGCTITRATLLADVSGSVVVDIFKCTYANFDVTTHPVAADKITASAPPTITTAVKSQDATLTGWTTAIAAGDILAFNINSVTTIKRVTLSLRVNKT